MGRALVTITAPHFCASLIYDGRVVRAAPILAYMMGWQKERILAYCRRKRWTVEAQRLGVPYVSQL